MERVTNQQNQRDPFAALIRMVKIGRVKPNREGKAETNLVDRKKIKAGRENQSPVNSPGSGLAEKGQQ